MTQPNIRRLRQMVGADNGRADLASTALVPVSRKDTRASASRVLQWLRSCSRGTGTLFGEIFEICENAVEHLDTAECWGVFFGVVAYLMSTGEPFPLRAIVAAGGFFGGWGLYAIVIMAAGWAVKSIEKHPGLWMLFGIVVVLRLFS